jgi:hypothetical protein
VPGRALGAATPIRQAVRMPESQANS